MTHKTTIRIADITYANKIAALSINSWRKAYANILPQKMLDDLSIETITSEWNERLTCKHSSVLVAELNDAVVGFVNFGDYREDYNNNIAEIYAIYTEHNHWAAGIGTSLLSQAISHISNLDFRQVVLWVFVKNKIARSFYEKNGFYESNETKQEARLDNLVQVKYIKSLL